MGCRCRHGMWHIWGVQTYQVSRISRETPAFWTPSPAHPPHRQNLPHSISKASFHLTQLQKWHPECTKTRIFELKNRKISPDVTPSGERDIGASLSAPLASRSRRQSSSPAGLFLNLGSSASWRKTAGIEFV